MLYCLIEKVNYENIYIYASITWNSAIEFYSQENIEISLIRISVDM